MYGKQKLLWLNQRKKINEKGKCRVYHHTSIVNERDAPIIIIIIPI